jgi:dTDP-4-dehydrorhamnose reductase
VTGPTAFPEGPGPARRPRVLLTGATGRLGAYVLRDLAGRGLDVVAWAGRAAVDLEDPAATAAAFRHASPTVVLHTAAVSSIEECERDPALARRANAGATRHLAELAAGAGARFVFTSTDLVFDGDRGGYRETDAPGPRSTYAATKLAGEEATHAAGGVVVRLSLLYGPGLAGRRSFFDHLVSEIRAGRPVRLFADEWRTPLAYPAAAGGLIDVALSDFTGLLHLGGPERMSRLEMGLRLAAVLKGDPAAVVATTRAAAGLADRPRDTSLDSTLWRRLFPGTGPAGYEDEVERMLGTSGGA